MIYKNSVSRPAAGPFYQSLSPHVAQSNQKYFYFHRFDPLQFIKTSLHSYTKRGTVRIKDPASENYMVTWQECFSAIKVSI